MNEELKPCPFCGKDEGEIVIDKCGDPDQGDAYLYVFCTACYSQSTSLPVKFGHLIRHATKKAIEAWNKRA